jgi:hypothetical protein
MSCVDSEFKKLFVLQQVLQGYVDPITINFDAGLWSIETERLPSCIANTLQEAVDKFEKSIDEIRPWY